MSLKQDFRPLALENLIDTCKEYKEKGYRLDQLLPKLERDNTITLIYTFVLDNEIVNFKIGGIIKNETVVPSVTELFIAAFVFENEAHELYGVNIEGNVLDFKGNFYKFPDGVEAPMAIISPEQLAAREKAAKIAAAKAAREAKAKASRESDGSNESTPDSKTESTGQNTEDLEAKLAGMDPEKAAKVRAAMEAKAKREAARGASAQSESKEGE